MNPTQVQYPWRAAVRTALAYIVGAGIVLPIAYGIFADQLGAYLPPDVLAGIAWTVGILVAVSATVTRIMAIPQINDWLTAIGVGAQPSTEGDDYEPKRMEGDA